MHSNLLYASPVSTSALSNHAIQKKLFLAQRRAALKIVSAYRTVSTSVALVLALRRETIVVSLLQFPCGHSLFAPGGALQGRPLSGGGCEAHF